MARKSLLRRYSIPETKEQAMDWLCGNNPSGKQYTPYWDEEYGKCYFRPRIAGKGTTQHFISLLGIQSKADCEHIRKELRRLRE